MQNVMDRATATRAAVLALRSEIERMSLDCLGDVAREIADLDERIDPVDVAYAVASEIESAAREALPHLPLLDPELLVDPRRSADAARRYRALGELVTRLHELQAATDDLLTCCCGIGHPQFVQSFDCA